MFFFQAEDGIRDLTVTGVQTCALPISKLPEALPRAVQSALIQHARKAPVNAGPKIPRAGPRREQRNIASPQVFNLSRNQLRKAWLLPYFFPEPVKQTITVQAIAQHIRMRTFLQQFAVTAGTP